MLIIQLLIIHWLPCDCNKIFVFTVIFDMKSVKVNKSWIYYKFLKIKKKI